MSESKSKSPQQPVKVFIVGNPSVGKSSLAKALQTETSALGAALASIIGPRLVSGVEQKTAGIVPCQFTSKKYGPVILYDLGGQVEYYASHTALLQSSESSSTPLFIIVVNLCESEEGIKQKLVYWMSFLAKHCTYLTTKPHVIIVGSHSDIVRSRGDDPSTKVNIEVLHVIRSSSFQISKFIPMDCRQSNSRDIVKLADSIKRSCDALRKKSGVAYELQQLFLFLQDRFKGVSAVAFKKVLSVSSTLNINEVPMSVKDLHYSFRQLHDAGLITYLENANVMKSWIVLDQATLLSRVTNVIFANQEFVSAISTIGVVPVSRLFQRLPHHNPNMLAQLLCYLEFCYEIHDHEVLQLISQGHTPETTRERYLFFPRLIHSCAPSGLWEDGKFPLLCDWMLLCCEAGDFLTYQFLQVLLLRIAFSCAHALARDTEVGSDHLVLQSKYRYYIWKNGIYWDTQEGVKALVEIRNPPQNREVVVMLRCMSGKEVECAHLRSTIIQMVLKAKQKFCPMVTTKEFFLHPSQVRRYPLKSLAEQNLISIKDISKTVVEGASHMCDSYGRVIDLKKLLLFEPYANLGVNILQQLFDRKTEVHVVSDSFLCTIAELIPNEKDSLIEMLKVSRIRLDHLMIQNGSSSIDLMCVLQCWRGDSGTYQSLRETLDQFSVFAGRNPLVSHYCAHFATTSSAIHTAYQICGQWNLYI